MARSKRIFWALDPLLWLRSHRHERLLILIVEVDGIGCRSGIEALAPPTHASCA